MARTLAASGVWGVLLFAAAAPALAGAPLQAEALKAYRGDDGQGVEIVTLAPRKAAEVLIRVRGTDARDDGIALRCAVEDVGRGIDYVTRHRGTRYTLVVQRDGVYEVFLPGKPSFRVKFNSEATDKASAAEVIAAHLQQLESGQVAAFQKKQWPHLEQKYAGRAASALADLQKACGTQAAFTFDWKTFSDEVMGELDVWAACAPLVAQARSHCAAVKGVTSLVCRFGPVLSLERADSTLVFTTTARGAAEGPAVLAKSLSP
ncbi:hypothetical protein POL68_24180 [Stigmatella sp. ncwal1]|uniref:Uncharacterized protein n=1 Tax=Stigmatella ashevillensis TaxID=2995309 RepID=A0ABT5DEK3_9BACT|nr:hypothetical protein [Stigmatella ashevillena]MDC0711590.1 hypothetical protein [Stigmatella ashevillena]